MSEFKNEMILNQKKIMNLFLCIFRYMATKSSADNFTGTKYNNKQNGVKYSEMFPNTNIKSSDTIISSSRIVKMAFLA